jgi:hypothetical protein
MGRVFTIASDAAICEMIAAARERLVLASPGFTVAVAQALAARIGSADRPLSVSVTVDADPEVCRLGFGELEALSQLTTALGNAGHVVQTQRGLRIGLVVADDDVLVYSPTPRIIEGDPQSDESPNAVRLPPGGPARLASACGVPVKGELPLGQEVGNEVVTEAVLAATTADLQENPPRAFDLSRLERVFNYKLEFVEFSLDQFRLNTRTVPLSAEILGLGSKDLQNRIRNTFRVFEAGTPFEFLIPDPLAPKEPRPVTEKWLIHEANQLRKDYLIPMGVGNYGNLILKRNKGDFVIGAERIKTMVTAYAAHVRQEIRGKIAQTRDSLVEALLPGVTASPPRSWLKQSVEGTLGEPTLRSRLGAAVDVAFKTVEIEFDPRVTWVFKGVTYETIKQDDHFRERLEKHFGKDDAAKLLSEYEASRAHEKRNQ